MNKRQRQALIALIAEADNWQRTVIEMTGYRWGRES